MTPENDTIITAPEEQPATDTAQTDAAPKRSRKIFRVCALIGILCAIAAWLLFYPQPVYAVVVGAAGLCASVCGLWSGRGCLRSLDITALVATAVLLLIYAAFYLGLPWAVTHL